MAKKAIKKKSRSTARKASARKAPARKKAKPAAKRAAKGLPRKKTKPAKSSRVEPSTPASSPAPGAFIWHELTTTDVAGSRDFYQSLFGWKASETEMMPGFMYTMFNHQGEPSAGVMEITPAHGDVKPAWHTYVHVRNVDATAAKAEELGGEVLVPPHDIPMGRWAMIRDPAGAVICVYKPST